jgi:hypothetical protein
MKTWNRLNTHKLFITRIAPGDGQVRVDWIFRDTVTEPSYVYEVVIQQRGIQESMHEIIISNNERTVMIPDLLNGRDYEIHIRAIDEHSNTCVLESPVRLVRPGVVPGTVVNYIHPEDYTYASSGRSPASPSIIRLPDGRLLASHDIYWGKAGQNMSQIFRSADEGVTWEWIADLFPCFWGKLFVHQEKLYMIACATEYGELLMGCSEDGGETWSKPSVLLEGGSRELGGPHRAPMPVVEYGGRLWTSLEFGSWDTGGHQAGVISAPLDADLLEPNNWSITPFLPYDSQWPGTIQGGDAPAFLEGNIVVTPEGQLVNILRYHTKRGNPDYGKAIVLNVPKDDPDGPLDFVKVIHFHGNMSKFTIQYDSLSGMYWTLVNRVTSTNVSQRNIVTLVSSKDAENWEIVRDVLDYEHNGHAAIEDSTKVGFQYVDWLVDGEDILFLSRTAINGAYNYHNANHITFHRLPDFRR